MNSAPWFCPLCGIVHTGIAEDDVRIAALRALAVAVAANVGVALNLPRITPDASPVTQPPTLPERSP